MRPRRVHTPRTPNPDARAWPARAREFRNLSRPSHKPSHTHHPPKKVADLVPDARRAAFERVRERTAWEPPMGTFCDSSFGHEAPMPWGAASSSPPRASPRRDVEQAQTPDWFNPANRSGYSRDPLTGLGMAPGSRRPDDDCIVS